MPDNDAKKPKPDFSKVSGTPGPSSLPKGLSPSAAPTTPNKGPGPSTTAANPVKSPSAAAGKPDFSNVQTGGSSTAKVLHAEKVETEYTIKAGDTLSKIAKRVYGDAKLWTRIFEANKATIKNPDLIHPGQVIKLPSAPEGGNV